MDFWNQKLIVGLKRIIVGVKELNKQCERQQTFVKYYDFSIQGIQSINAFDVAHAAYQLIL